jgi:hypothetical protein
MMPRVLWTALHDVDAVWGRRQSVTSKQIRSAVARVWTEATR